MAEVARIIDGKEISARIRQSVKVEVARLNQQGVAPGLATVLVGDDPGSSIYVGMKVKACAAAGIRCDERRLAEKVSEAELLALVDELNRDEKIDGILIQLPLPAHLDESRVLEAVSPHKDVDGFHPYNVGRLALGRPLVLPCTPRGILRMLDETGVDLQGKEVVVIGRSNLVGKPMALMCQARDATVTLCHSHTRDLARKVGAADVVIAAVGRPELVRGAWIKEGAVVIDVGMNRVGEKKVVGDVEFAVAVQRAEAITPVPGGVGPMTITMLLCNTVESAGRRLAGQRS